MASGVGDSPFSITQSDASALDNPAFAENRPLLETWLKTPKVPGTDKDSLQFRESGFELLMDLRGYSLTNIRVDVSDSTIVVDSSINGLITKKNFEVPISLNPEEYSAVMSSDGFLLVSVAWQK